MNIGKDGGGDTAAFPDERIARHAPCAPTQFSLAQVASPHSHIYEYPNRRLSIAERASSEPMATNGGIWQIDFDAMTKVDDFRARRPSARVNWRAHWGPHLYYGAALVMRLAQACARCHHSPSVKALRQR